jgi:hypothetical protein
MCRAVSGGALRQAFRCVPRKLHNKFSTVKISSRKVSQASLFAMSKELFRFCTLQGTFLQRINLAMIIDGQ